MAYRESNSTGAPFAAAAVLYFARTYNSHQTKCVPAYKTDLNIQ